MSSLLDSRAALRGLGGLFIGLAAWLFLSPLYDRALARTATLILRSFERPPVTQIRALDERRYVVDRADFGRTSQRPVIAIRNLTVSFVLLTALFALPKRPFADDNVFRFVLASIALSLTHLFGVVAEVMSIYTLRLGAWSSVHYSALERNFWGAASHSYQLVLMYGFAFGAWWGFRPAPVAAAPRARKRRRAAAAERRG